MADEKSLRDLMQEGLDELNSGTDDTDGTAENAETAGTTESATSEKVTEGKKTEGAEGAEGGTSEGLEATEEDTPTEYFGTDLSGLPAKERADIIAGFKDRDRHIQQLLRKQAEEAKATGEKSEAKTDSAGSGGEGEVTGADILSALGLDPARAEDPDDDTKAIIGLGRFALDLQSQVKGVVETSSVRETKQLWETTLASMEESYGKLPDDITRMDIYKLAVENGIADPVDAYWRIMGPARHDIMAQVKARREAATKLVAEKQTQTKPKADGKTEKNDLLEGVTDTREAIKKALGGLAEEKGWDLESPDLFDNS